MQIVTPVLLAAALVAGPATAVAPKAAPTITIDLQQAEVVNVIRLLAEVGHKNVVIADDVKGKVSLKLRGVAWRTALDIVLKSNGYGLVEEDNVIWVTSQARLDAEEQRELDLEESRALKGPLSMRVVPVNYARAEDMAALVRPLLSPRGTVSVDDRSNTIIIRDVGGSSSLSRF